MTTTIAVVDTQLRDRGGGHGEMKGAHGRSGAAARHQTRTGRRELEDHALLALHERGCCELPEHKAVYNYCDGGLGGDVR